MTTGVVSFMLDAQQILEDDLADGDPSAHRRVTAVFGGLDESTILSFGAPLGRLYRWLRPSERDQLRASCPAWALFEPVRTAELSSLR